MKHKHFLFLIALLFSCFTYGQEKVQPAYIMELEKADQCFQAKKYNTAAQLYQRVYPKIKELTSKEQTLYKIAESYRLSNNFGNALKWYENLVNSKYPDPQILFNYAQLLKNFERYEDATRVFNDYLFEMPDNKLALEAIEGCKQAADWKAKPERFLVKNLTQINTPYSDYGPYFHEQHLYFSSSRKEAQGNGIFEWTGQKYADIFSSQIMNGSPLQVVSQKNINTDFNEGALCMDSLQNIYFTQCNGADGKGLNCKILVSYFTENKYSNPQVLPFNSDSFSCGHPFWDNQYKYLYFASDRPGGMGKKDIWKTQYSFTKNEWSKPENLGTTINTNEDELFPSFDQKGNLYVASKGHIGMGGLDIFKCSTDSPNTIKNMGSPINSGADDLGLHWSIDSNGAMGYFSSNRPGGTGDDDLYAIYAKPFQLIVNGTIIDRETEKPVPSAFVGITEQDSKNIVQIKSDEDGQFSSSLLFNKNYAFSASKNSYLNSGIALQAIVGQNDTTIQVIVWLDRIPAKEAELTVQGIYYDLDQWQIRKDAEPVLDSLAAVLKLNPGLVIELASHTDSRAEAPYNLDLSKKRANSCVSYLVNKGIDNSRLVPAGYGEQFLVNNCSDGIDCSEAEHQANRRTTIKFLKTDSKIKVR